MIRPRRNLAFRVGVLTVAVLGTFAALLLGVVGVSFGRDESRYTILFDENVKGMVIGSKVNFQGVPVGAVRDIAFRGGSTEVVIVVDPTRAEIQDVTEARLDRLLVTGQVTVELEGFAHDAKPLLEGSRIPARLDPLSDLKASLPDVVGRVEGTLILLDSVLLNARTLLGPENQARVSGILDNLEAASASLPKQVSGVLSTVDREVSSLAPVLADARSAIDQLASAASKVGSVLDTAELGETLAAARRAIARLESVESGAVALLREGSSLLAGVREPLHSTLRSTRESMREIRGFARTLRMAPTSLLSGAERPPLTLPASPPGDR